MTPKERASAVLDYLEKKGVQPLDDNGWMNPEDRDAITDPIADAIRVAVAEDRIERGGPKPLIVSNAPISMNVGADGLCQCSCADTCPLGKAGSMLRCSIAELSAAGILCKR
jgi:hypothetical protein